MAVAAIFALNPEPVTGQAGKKAPAAPIWTHPETPWGDPDLQGTWTSDDCIGTGLNRAANFGDRLYLTEQELADRQGKIAAKQKQDLVETVAANQKASTGPPGHWGERARRPCRQTSLVIDPPNGRTPEMLAEAKSRPAGQFNVELAESWTDFTYYIRCITRGVPGSIFPVIYGNGQQIVQGQGFVTILQEMVHEARVIPLDGRPHASPSIRSYMGDSRGRWEGKTLVVETTNFLGNRTGITGNGGGIPTSDAMKLTERFTRVGPDEIQYEITIDDPKTYVRPFKVGFPLTQEPGYQNFEYACHEGNNAMFNSLSGARAREKA
ncbi:MAG TPA: hypothetical protein VI457_00495, partial [Methylococcaceae bacterium]|nr:hypothetical protein [Methylococcaceae bacterium]